MAAPVGVAQAQIVACYIDPGWIVNAMREREGRR